jgi:hypothetical protein
VTARAGVRARAALVSVAVLGGVIAILASSSASGAADVHLLLNPPGQPAPRRATTPSPPSPPSSCALPSTAAAGSDLEVTGACQGHVTTGFACLAALDDLYLSVRVPVDREHYFYLTLNVESYKGPRAYRQVQTVAQLTGPTGVERWSGRDATVLVHADHSLQVSPALLSAEPGTGSAGSISVTGLAGCLP